MYPFLDDENVKDYIFSKRLAIDAPFTGTNQTEKWNKLNDVLLEHHDKQGNQVFPGSTVELLKDRHKAYLKVAEYFLDKDGGSLNVTITAAVESDLEQPEYATTELAARIKNNVEKVICATLQQKEEEKEMTAQKKAKAQVTDVHSKFFRQKSVNNILLEPNKRPPSAKKPPATEERLGDIKMFMTMFNEKEKKREDRQKRKLEEQKEELERKSNERKEDVSIMVQTVTQAMVPLAEAMVKSFAEALKSQGK